MNELYYEEEKLKSLQNIEKDIHSIGNSLNKIAVALERISGCVYDGNNPSEFNVRNRSN